MKARILSFPAAAAVAAVAAAAGLIAASDQALAQAKTIAIDGSSTVFPVQEAIVVCCIDHPIAGMLPACATTTPDCINYLTANLNQTSASTIDVMEGCAEYVRILRLPPEE